MSNAKARHRRRRRDRISTGNLLRTLAWWRKTKPVDWIITGWHREGNRMRVHHRKRWSQPNDFEELWLDPDSIQLFVLVPDVEHFVEVPWALR